jgi:hypothetical protein
VAVLVAVLAAAAVAAPAHATLTPAGAAVEGTSVDSGFASSSLFSIRCPISRLTGASIAANGLSVSGRWTFEPSAGATCMVTIVGSSSSADIACTGRVTLRSTSSVASTSAVFTLQLDPDFSCVFRSNVYGCSWTMAGPQTSPNAASFSQATQTLHITTTVSLRGSGGFCQNASVSFDGTYRISPRITVS